MPTFRVPLQGKSHQEAWRKVQTVFWPALVRNVIIWGLAQYVNMSYVPVKVSYFGILWCYNYALFFVCIFLFAVSSVVWECGGFCLEHLSCYNEEIAKIMAYM